LPNKGKGFNPNLTLYQGVLFSFFTNNNRSTSILKMAKKVKRYSPALRQKAAEIAKILEGLYPETPIPLEHGDVYTLLVAVLLSAQCTDVRVNQVTPHLFALADNPFAMKDLDVKTIENVIRPCGLSPRKSQAISELSKILVEQYAGQVPQDWQALEALPGVGHKTASVVMSQGFGVPAFPVDTHIHRLAWRWGLSDGKNVENTERDLKALFPEAIWNKLHLQIIFFGREYCPARGHDPLKCPVCSKYGRKELFTKA
jgi:endonuclease-3